MKKVFSAIAAMLIIAVSHAQYTYTNETNQPTVEKSVSSIASDDNGNLVLAGRFFSSISIGGFTLTNSNGPSAAFIAKKMANGSYSWAKAIIQTLNLGNVTSVGINGVSVDAAGNAYVTGSFKGKISFDNIILSSLKSGNTYHFDMFTAKVSPTGAFLWAKSAGTTNVTDLCSFASESGSSVTSDNGGNVYAVGALVDKVFKNTNACNYPCPPPSNPNSTSSCAYVVKYNSSGTKQWERKYINSQANGSTCTNGLVATDVESDGNNIYIYGQITGSVSFGNVILNTGGVLNVFLLKLDANGNTIWAKSVTNGTNTCNSNGGPDQLYLDKNTNNLYLTGRFEVAGTLSFGGLMLTGTQYAKYLAKYSSTGICSWATLTEGVSLGVRQHPNGNLVMLLRQSSVVVDTFSIKEISPIDGSTVALTTADFDVSLTHVVNDGIVSIPNGFIFAQTLRGTYDFGGTSISGPGSGYDDIILVKYTMPAPPFAQSKISTTATPSIKTTEPLPGMTLYPNPASNQITIQNNSQKMLGTISIYDVSGKMIYKNFVGSSQTTIDLENFSQGVYYVRSDQMQVTIKFVKQ